MKKKFELPGWIDLETWNEYEKMRKAIRKPMTDRARKIAVTRLEQFRRIGYEAKDILEQSIFMSWQGLFEVKGASNGRKAEPSKAEQRTERVREATKRVLGVDSGLDRYLRGELREGTNGGNDSGLPHRLIGSKTEPTS